MVDGLLVGYFLKKKKVEVHVLMADHNANMTSAGLSHSDSGRQRDFLNFGVQSDTT